MLSQLVTGCLRRRRRVNNGGQLCVGGTRPWIAQGSVLNAGSVYLFSSAGSCPPPSPAALRGQGEGYKTRGQVELTS